MNGVTRNEIGDLELDGDDECNDDGIQIDEGLIDDTDWFDVQQMECSKRNVKAPKVTVTLSEEMWIKECKKSFKNVDLPLIPVVVNQNNNHWIEWIKIIFIESQNIYVGISCKYDEGNNKWSVQSIFLDRGDIYNKHRLVGFKRDKYKDQLKHFKTSITEIIFSDNESKQTLSTLQHQFKRQHHCIVRLNESLLKAKNANLNSGPYAVFPSSKLALIVCGYSDDYIPEELQKLIVCFLYKLLLQRNINETDLNRINWSNIRLFKPQWVNNNNSRTQLLKITHRAFTAFCLVAMERLNNNNNNLIPIIDEHHSYYGIEWVLIVHIVHKDCNVGISFKYDDELNVVVATAIYLDAGEIESKHKLIGLELDCCTRLGPFSLTDIEFIDVSEDEDEDEE